MKIRLLFLIALVPGLLATSGCYYKRVKSLEAAQQASRETIQQLQSELNKTSQDYLDRIRVLEREKATLDRQLTATREDYEATLTERNEREERLTVEKQQLSAQVERLQYEKEQLEKKVENISTELSQLRKDFNETTQRNADLGDTLQSATGKLKKAEERAAALKEELDQTEGDLTEWKNRFEKEESARKKAENKVGEMEKELETAQTKLSESSAGSARDNPALKDALALLKASLEPLIQQNSAAVSLEKTGLVIRLSADYLFQPDSVMLDPAVEPTLDQIAGVAMQYKKLGLRVEGHTDSQPIINLPFEDNWGLGAERAAKVVRYLCDFAGIDPKRVKSVSCSGYRPLPDGLGGFTDRRRVEIILTPEP